MATEDKLLELVPTVVTAGVSLKLMDQAFKFGTKRKKVKWF